MEKANQYWQLVKEKLKEKIDDSTFNSTFADINEIYKYQSNYIYLPVPDILSKYRIDKFYLNDMNEILAEFVQQKTLFKLITLDEIEKDKEKLSQHPIVSADDPNKIKSRKLRAEYSFGNFVTGESNREAWTYSVKVAESPYVTMNPLYIFGDVGLGKTHLMTAIGNYILDNNVSANIIFTTAQQFTQDYFKATNKSNRNGDSLEEFNEFYRSADVLLVDDIQFLKEKPKTQEEFFKIFEYLHENNKQIVVTSDRPASELEIMDRLKSRFSWGMPVDVRKPNFALRKEILKLKLKFLISDPSVVPDEVLDYIATNFDENVRDLEGSLRRFVSCCVAFNYPYTLEQAIETLSSLIPKDKHGKEEDNSVIIDKIKQTVATYYNVSVKDLSAETRKKDIAYARMVTIYLIRTLLNVQLKRIGDYLGGRDHSTVAHSYEKIKIQIEEDLMVKKDIEILIQKINQN